jgi:carbamate kinase
MTGSPPDTLPRRLLVAIGGNATHPETIEGTSIEQKAIAAETAEALLPLALMDNELIITHGNGPVVGKILMRQVLTRDRIAPMPLDICVAHSQGGIAYLLMQALENALRKADSERHVACLLTQVEVDKDDPAFANPTKPIGPFFTEEEAMRLADELGWLMREDSGRGWRHVVPSPRPRHIVDISLVRVLARRGTIVIAGGGGGIPVVRGQKGERQGVAAVIDKDMTSALMANVLGIDTLMILTAVEQVAINFGTSRQRALDRVDLAALKAYRREGHFAAGSMGPKIDAAIRFLEDGGERVIIAHIDQAMAALEGRAGTIAVAASDGVDAGAVRAGTAGADDADAGA